MYFMIRRNKGYKNTFKAKFYFKVLFFELGVTLLTTDTVI